MKEKERYKRAIVWFKRDLRIEDNEALFEASVFAEEIIPIFIFIPSLFEIFGKRKDRLGFIVSALKKLDKDLRNLGGKLYVFVGEPREIFSEIIKTSQAQGVFTNKDFSFTGEEIESEIRSICLSFGIDFHVYLGNFLCDITKIPFKRIYSHFLKEWLKNLRLDCKPIPTKINVPEMPFSTLDNLLQKLEYEENRHFTLDFGFQRLNNFDFRRYNETRNRLDLDGTSKLSPYIRFGVLSLRKIFKKAEEVAGKDCQFIKELAWREFWYHIKHYFPQLKELEFQEKRRNIPWENDEKLFKAFIDGRTGYPIVDAGIRQLLLEGFMHNRARMIVASFLTKDLFIDWRLGEAFFKEHLIDYDEVVNTGNWQWVASVGVDLKPFRMFNPILQAKNFDPEAKYIKRYLPELKNLPPYMLHNPLRYKLPYLQPIVNHFDRARVVKKYFLLSSVIPKARA
ncbi:deoxyribodipyrimidine photo-lyase [Thermodesulfobacterium sp. TA1]|uniref:cryptochrome/photolyase family protein n=1 Tax=Thermodesulfobacterium sp. TA1 TaxID=2234087 RepID=UPI00123196AD|nr:deoxyribodipyrimidine photo-lyase [Thermodesulfobacterium sp. TA1]QER41656.1 deoxyribodipyrimidine photo-lyase [Thermodesulfobacterium sp. TA1]